MPAAVSTKLRVHFRVHNGFVSSELVRL